MTKALLLGLALLLLAVAPAQAQRGCDKWLFKNFAKEQPQIEIVPAVEGHRIYICGYALIAASASVDIEFVSGTGQDCGSEPEPLSPLIKLPSGGILVNRIHVVSEFTPIGHALCVRTQGQGDLIAILYWTQF